MKAIAACLVILLGCVAKADPPRQFIGLDGSMTAVLPPGAHLAPQDSRTDVLVQIASTRPLGSGVEATLRFWPMTAGEHDLRNNLLNADDKPLIGPTPLLIHGVSSLPSNWKGALTTVAPSPLSSYGGYRTFRIAAAVIWIVSLIPIVALGQRRRVPVMTQAAAPEPVAPQRPLAELILAKAHLSPRDRRRLEMLLIQKWQIAHGLTDEPIYRALQRLRGMPDIAAALEQLHIWLHAPADRSQAVDADRLLAPYSAESME